MSEIKLQPLYGLSANTEALPDPSAKQIKAALVQGMDLLNTAEMAPEPNLDNDLPSPAPTQESKLDKKYEYTPAAPGMRR